MPDQLRAAFIQAEPAGFIRHSVHTEATPDGQRLHYTVEDRQQWRNLGPRSAAVSVKGDATAGVDWPSKEIKGLLRTMGGALTGAWDLLDGKLGAAAGAWAGLIRTAKARVTCRVKGHAQAELADLVNTGVVCCLDRFAPLSMVAHTLFPVSAFISDQMDNEQGPQVLVKMEFLPVTPNVFQAMLNPARIGKIMNLKGDIVRPDNQAPFIMRDPAFGNPRLPASGGSRDHWVSMLVTQILGTPTVPVAAVPADGVPPRLEFTKVV